MNWLWYCFLFVFVVNEACQSASVLSVRNGQYIVVPDQIHPSVFWCTVFPRDVYTLLTPGFDPIISLEQTVDMTTIDTNWTTLSFSIELDTVTKDGTLFCLFSMFQASICLTWQHQRIWFHDSANVSLAYSDTVVAVPEITLRFFVSAMQRTVEEYTTQSRFRWNIPNKVSLRDNSLTFGPLYARLTQFLQDHKNVLMQDTRTILRCKSDSVSVSSLDATPWNWPLNGIWIAYQSPPAIGNCIIATCIEDVVFESKCVLFPRVNQTVLNFTETGSLDWILPIECI